MSLRRGRKLVMLCFLCLLCTGCWDSSEIDQLAIIIASGFDQVTDEATNQSEVLGTAQVALSSELGSSGGGTPTTSTGSTDAFVLEQAKGPSVLAALDILRKRMSRKLFLGQRRVIVVGEDFAKKGVYDLADEIVRNPQSRLRSYIVVAYHSQAQDILKLPYPLNRLPADAISDLETKGAVPNVDAKRLLEGLCSFGDPFLLGVEQIPLAQSLQDSTKQTFALTHIAIFQKDKLVGWLGGPELRGFMWIYGKLEREDSTVNIPNVPGFISARMLDLDTTRSVKLVNGKPQIKIETRTQYDIAQNGTPLNLNDPANMARVRTAIRKEIHNQIQATMNDLQKTYQSDPFEFADMIYKKHPAAWKHLQINWRATYRDIPVAITVNVKIRNSGLTGPSIRAGAQGT